jgi:hypothetical protein
MKTTEHCFAQRRKGRRDKINCRSFFLVFLCVLRVLCAKKILANMRDPDRLQCKEHIEKNLCCSFFVLQ